MWGIPVPSRVQGNLGNGWGKEIRSGSGIPSDASGNLGDRYFDTTAQRWYLKRWVGLFSGIDKLAVPKDIIGTSGDFEISALMRLGSASLSTSQALFSHGISTGGRLALIRQLGVGVVSLARLGAGNYGIPANVPTGEWLKFKMYRLGSTVGYVIGNASYSAAEPGGYSSADQTVLGTVNSTGTAFIACNFKASGQGNAFNLPIDDGLGATIRDISGNGNDGILTDGAPTNNFWSQLWVPMDLL